MYLLFFSKYMIFDLFRIGSVPQRMCLLDPFVFSNLLDEMELFGNRSDLFLIPVCDLLKLVDPEAIELGAQSLPNPGNFLEVIAMLRLRGIDRTKFALVSTCRQITFYFGPSFLLVWRRLFLLLVC